MKQIHARKETLKKFMHWPRKIHAREMLTKETHAAPPNTFLMVRFKCCFSMNISSNRNGFSGKVFRSPKFQ